MKSKRAVTTRKQKRKKAGLLDELTLFCRLTSAIASTLDLERLLDAITRNACQLVEVQICTLRLFDKKKGLIPAFSYGLDLEKFKALEPVKLGQDIAGKAVKNKKQAWTLDVMKEPGFKYPGFLKKPILRSVLCTPLTTREKVIGVLSIYTVRVHRFTEKEKKVMLLFANEATIAIENARLMNRIHDAYINTLKALGTIVDAFDWHTERHSEKVRDYAVAIAKEMRVPEDKMRTIEFAALIHDVGKVGIDLNIIRKPGSLNDEEWKQIVKHPALGAGIAERIGMMDSLVPLIMYHHERYGGKGYPEGLKGRQIPLGARILSVADSYDAMTAERPYKKAMTKDEAIEEIKKNSGTQFDPKVVKAFLAVVKDFPSV